ncbi:SMI1/KNR4 family protein [Rhizobium deserti]|uniref:SMI1/KNR4 family protein n=1 Tax=Rhizobium deserti TaxID=2547961 RepID=A0A4R5UMU3_9HYPH|nr:SMI1/KNR4 family protein [Rhizobium deserti]TDK39196.1 SMI1/KNR4 family protein [Rhizobium deserti]
MTTKRSGGLRLFLAAVIVLAVIVPGFLNRSPWIILLSAPAYTTLYALGKWSTWTLAWRTGGVRAILLAVAITLPIQLVLVVVFYMIGLGASLLLGQSSGLQPLASVDVVTAGALFLIALAISLSINFLEARGSAADLPPIADPRKLDTDAAFADEVEVELDLDPRPLTPQNFYVSRGYWKRDALYDALEGRGKPVVKQPDAASDKAIATAEARLGVQLPESLRDLYRIMDGGYVGWLYVPLKDNPRPVDEDWRGAFSIDYSSLASLDQLQTVKEHYESFTHDSDEMPRNADKMIVLQARYQDMTLLDYTHGPEPKVRLVDFDRHPDLSTDVEYSDFKSYFAALRRPRPEKLISSDRLLSYRNQPIAKINLAQQPSEFWLSGVHVFANIAHSRKDGSAPKKQADDDLVAETEARLGVKLPHCLVRFWKYRNGGALAARHLQISKPEEGYAEIELPDQLMPMEYFATLAEASDRISYPEGETSLRKRHAGADRLVILQAKDKEAVLLDYRGNTLEPGILVVDDINSQHLASAVRVNSFDLLLERLRAWKQKS